MQQINSLVKYCTFLRRMISSAETVDKTLYPTGTQVQLNRTWEVHAVLMACLSELNQENRANRKHFFIFF